jgi:hypothetical protein
MTAVEIKRRMGAGPNRTGETVWMVTGVATVAEALGDATFLAAADIGQKFPGVPTLKASEHMAEQVEGSKPGEAYRITVRYEPKTGAGWDIDQPEPSEIGFVEVNVDYSPTIVDTWRVAPLADGSGWGQPPDGLNSLGDIGGTPVDSAGEPVSSVRRMMEIVISHTISGFPPYAALAGFEGSRNSTDYLTFTAGFLLLKGISTSRIAVSVYTLDYTFVFDEWAHSRQIPNRDADGKVVLSGSTPHTADQVYWRQPFPRTNDFYSLGIPTQYI